MNSQTSTILKRNSVDKLPELERLALVIIANSKMALGWKKIAERVRQLHLLQPPSERAVWAAITELEAKGIVKKASKHDISPRYRLTPAARAALRLRRKSGVSSPSSATSKP